MESGNRLWAHGLVKDGHVNVQQSFGSREEYNE